jgi:hypothetical protein
VRRFAFLIPSLRSFVMRAFQSVDMPLDDH